MNKKDKEETKPRKSISINKRKTKSLIIPLNQTLIKRRKATSKLSINQDNSDQEIKSNEFQ